MNVKAEEAAAIGVPYLAALSALEVAAKLKSGETVLVTGASGAVGRAATQIAHWKGARVIGASRSSDNPYGADAIINTIAQDLVSEAHQLTGGTGVDVVLDVVGGPLFEKCLAALCHGGRQVAISSNPPVVSLNLVEFYHKQLQLFGVDTMGLSGLEVATLLNHLRDGFEEGVLTPPDIHSWAFDAAPKAYEMVADGSSARKQVLLLGN